jgi:hypothetical protein
MSQFRNLAPAISDIIQYGSVSAKSLTSPSPPTPLPSLGEGSRSQRRRRGEGAQTEPYCDIISSSNRYVIRAASHERFKTELVNLNLTSSFSIAMHLEMPKRSDILNIPDRFLVSLIDQK